MQGEGKVDLFTYMQVFFFLSHLQLTPNFRGSTSSPKITAQASIFLQDFIKLKGAQGVRRITKLVCGVLAQVCSLEACFGSNFRG